MILEMKLGSSLACCLSCRQKREGPSGRRSAVLAQISQKCVSCSNFPPKCVERSLMTVLLSHKHRLPPICKDSLANVYYVFRCCACRRSSRTLVVVDRRLSVLGALYHRSFCFGSWNYLRRLSVAFGGFLQQFYKNETNFFADSLLLKIGHISCKRIRRITKI
jgi:hypothetical protein